MADYLVQLDNEVDFAPASETIEIIQNVRTILATRIGTVPLHRELGTSWEHLDKPLQVSKMLLKVAVIDAITEFEPRAEVKSVDFDITETDALEGVLKPRVVITIPENDDSEGESIYG